MSRIASSQRPLESPFPETRSYTATCPEHHSLERTRRPPVDYAEDLAAEMLATTLDLEFDPDKSWDEKRELWRLSDKIVRTQNVTRTAVGDKNGLWTTVIAAAVLVG